ncbi:MAG TPA: IS91 family transposase [Lutibacter sp.]|nr:IS91 family transposase [Lutibacter sp.]
MVDLRNKYELADVVLRFGKQLVAKEKLSPGQTKALFNIVQCRTKALGGHKEKCNCCGEERYSYNSCGDRHCPKCQSNKQAIWVDELSRSTLAIKHYHIIFTVPHVLNDICLWNDREYYKILFSAVWRTLHSFGYTHYGAETGAVAILHSWGQNLSLHPHIHCIVPAAGFSLKGEWKNIGKYKNYLYPVHQLSDTFKGKFLDSIKRKLKKLDSSGLFKQQIEKAYKTKWVVYSEASLAGPEKVIHYLGQYTHRVAISNQRILDITDTQVKFIAKDYRDGAKQKVVELEGVEFLRRFCQHIMPKRFVRIRKYGIYNPIVKRNLNLQFEPEKKSSIEELDKSIEKETKAERIMRLTGFDSGKCPKCKEGRMYVVKELPRIRSPAGHLPSILLSIFY